MFHVQGYFQELKGLSDRGQAALEAKGNGGGGLTGAEEGH